MYLIKQFYAPQNKNFVLHSLLLIVDRTRCLEKAGGEETSATFRKPHIVKSSLTLSRTTSKSWWRQYCWPQRKPINNLYKTKFKGRKQLCFATANAIHSSLLWHLSSPFIHWFNFTFQSSFKPSNQEVCKLTSVRPSRTWP